MQPLSEFQRTDVLQKGTLVINYIPLEGEEHLYLQHARSRVTSHCPAATPWRSRNFSSESGCFLVLGCSQLAHCVSLDLPACHIPRQYWFLREGCPFCLLCLPLITAESSTQISPKCLGGWDIFLRLHENSSTVITSGLQNFLLP